MLPYVWQRVFRTIRFALALSCAGVESRQFADGID